MSGSEQEFDTSTRSIRKTFEPTPEAAAEARRYADELLHGWDAVFVGDVVLLVGELAANAVRHAATRFTLSLRLQTGSLLVSVKDANPAPPQLAELSPTAVGGRGLVIVNALSKSWGWKPVRGGKTVWATVHAPAGSCSR